MRRVSLGVLTLLVVLIGSSTLPARAQADSFIQPIMPLSSVRLKSIWTFDGTPLEVCEVEFASANRIHDTCNQLVTLSDLGLVTGRVVESVFYDNTVYQRVDQSTTWDSSSISDYNPQLTLNDLLFGQYLYPSELTATKMGEVQIDGTPTTHYQLWSHDKALNEANGGQYVYDIFVSGPGYVLQDQTSSRSDTHQFVRIWTYSDFNGPITVSPPPANLVKKAAAANGLGFAASLFKR